MAREHETIRDGYNIKKNIPYTIMCSAVRRGNSFRSVHAAMKEARDGDQIILRKGIHNGLGCALTGCQGFNATESLMRNISSPC